MPGTADVVAPVIYAIAGSRSAALLRDYKNHPSRVTRRCDSEVIGDIAGAALARHTACVEAKVGMPVSLRTTLPSLTSRPGTHPFTAVLCGLGVDIDHVLAVAPTATCHRIVRHDKFEVVSPAAVAGRHVLVIDDVWTTGSNAQSAALTLHRAGAGAVSVMAVGRWINPAYPPTARFLERHECTGFDPTVCPVTGGKCP
jgi:hypothetical protein